MTIKTLEKIHDLLRTDAKTRQTALNLTRKAYDARCDALETIRANVDRTDDPDFVSAVRLCAAAKAAYDRARHGSYEANAALEDFESQNF